MITINTNSVLGVMNMLSTEKSYIQFNRTLWVLRAIVMDKIECKYADESYGVNNKRDDYWMYELTNNLIATSWISGYDFYIQKHDVKYSVTKPRTGNSFMTYEEAQYIVDEVMSGKTLAYLIRLRNISSFAKNRMNDNTFHIYTLADDLLHAIIGEEKLIN